MTPITTFFGVLFFCVVMLIMVLFGGHKKRVEQRILSAERREDLSPSLPRYSARRIRNIRLGSLLLVPFYIFVIFIPNYYTWIADIPLIEGLQVTSGEFTYQNVGNRGNKLTGIKTASGTIYFSCSRGKFGENPDCLFPMSEYERLAGQPATVWWYEQQVNLFDTQKRVVRLVIASKEKVSYEKTVNLTNKSSRNAVWIMFVMLVVFILIVVGFERMIRR